MSVSQPPVVEAPLVQDIYSKLEDVLGDVSYEMFKIVTSMNGETLNELTHLLSILHLRSCNENTLSPEEVHTVLENLENEINKRGQE